MTKPNPAERLLVFDVKDGWEPLCTFLAKPIPAMPFPTLASNFPVDRLASGYDAIWQASAQDWTSLLLD